jgi:HD superfamily phosphohydrolase
MQEFVYYDPLYGYIDLCPTSKKIIQTPEFQRLRNIKQLGLASTVYTGATHTRFEHSIGTYHLSKKILNKIQSSCELTPKDITTISIAALCHDLGHGPVSHAFDDLFFKEKEGVSEAWRIHESRSCIILRYIVVKYGIIELNVVVDDICDLINPEKKHLPNYFYEIISGYIDVDKLDYLNRDCYHIGFIREINVHNFIKNCKIINKRLAFSKKIYYDILQLFLVRHRLHIEVYQSAKVRAMELLHVEFMKIVLKENYSSVDEFCRLNDSIFTSTFLECASKYLTPDEYLQGTKILDSINRVHIYELHKEIVFQNPEEAHNNYMQLRDTVDNDMLLDFSFIGFRENPMENILLFEGKKIVSINSKIYDYSECIIRYYKKNLLM